MSNAHKSYKVAGVMIYQEQDEFIFSLQIWTNPSDLPHMATRYTATSTANSEGEIRLRLVELLTTTYYVMAGRWSHVQLEAADSYSMGADSSSPRPPSDNSDTGFIQPLTSICLPVLTHHMRLSDSSHDAMIGYPTHFGK